MHKKISVLACSILLFAGIQVSAADCDGECLQGIADQYLQALLQKDYSDLPWGETVGFTENDVAMMIGDGLWGTATVLSDEHFLVADSKTGNVVWVGIVEEHGQAAYLGMRLKVQDKKITEVETVLGREGTPGIFTSTDGFKVDPIFKKPVSKKQSRSRLISTVKNYYKSKELNDGSVYVDFTDNCARRENGVSTTHGDAHWAAKVVNGCREQFESGLFRTTDSIRAIRFPIVNVETGVVVALSLHDQAVRYTGFETTDGRKIDVPVEYPNSFSLLEVFKIEAGKIQRIEAVSAFQPYLMPTKWH